MSIVSIIAAVDKNNGLGFNNKLLCHLPADLKHFKKVTINKPVIMGRNTFSSIGRALPGRKNIVVSSQQENLEEIFVTRTINEALEFVSTEPEVMIIGGAGIYEEALLFADKIYLTKIHHIFMADVFFPAIDSEQWECVEQSFRPADPDNAYDLTFYTYQKKTL